MRVTMAAGALTIALAASAAGAERQQWGFVDAGGEAQLFYGIPDSGSLTIAFICKSEQRQLELVTTVLPRRPRKGDTLRTTLRNGAVAASFVGTLGHTDEEGYFSEASAAFAPTVLDVVRSGARLTISVPGKQERVPLRGIAGPLAKFETACFRN